jgi:hypothetical protein
VVWISTANTYYALRGVSPGAALASARTRLRLGKPVRVGAHNWYLVPNGSSTGVLEVRNRVVEQIGIADKGVTRSRKAERAFLRSFG